MKTVQSREEFLTILAAYAGKESVGVEIGVLHGDFSAMILERVNPKYLYLIDPYEIGKEKYKNGVYTAYSTNDDYWNVKLRFIKEIQKGQVRFRREYSYQAVRLFQDHSLDFCYLDGSHLYKDVKKDMVEWLPKLKSNGVMCGHDYIRLEDFGVIEAVDEFIIENNFEWVLLNENGGDWMIKRKK